MKCSIMFSAFARTGIVTLSQSCHLPSLSRLSTELKWLNNAMAPLYVGEMRNGKKQDCFGFVEHQLYPRQFYLKFQTFLPASPNRMIASLETQFLWSHWLRSSPGSPCLLLCDPRQVARTFCASQSFGKRRVTIRLLPAGWLRHTEALRLCCAAEGQEAVQTFDVPTFLVFE